MNYIKNIFKLEDKFRLFMIIGLAAAILILTFAEPHSAHKDANNHKYTEKLHHR